MGSFIFLPLVVLLRYPALPTDKAASADLSFACHSIRHTSWPSARNFCSQICWWKTTEHRIVCFWLSNMMLAGRASTDSMPFVMRTLMLFEVSLRTEESESVWILQAHCRSDVTCQWCRWSFSFNGSRWITHPPWSCRLYPCWRCSGFLIFDFGIDDGFTVIKMNHKMFWQ